MDDPWRWEPGGPSSRTGQALRTEIADQTTYANDLLALGSETKRRAAVSARVSVYLTGLSGPVVKLAG